MSILTRKDLKSLLAPNIQQLRWLSLSLLFHSLVSSWSSCRCVLEEGFAFLVYLHVAFLNIAPFLASLGLHSCMKTQESFIPHLLSASPVAGTGTGTGSQALGSPTLSRCLNWQRGHIPATHSTGRSWVHWKDKSSCPRVGRGFPSSWRPRWEKPGLPTPPLTTFQKNHLFFSTKFIIEIPQFLIPN